jgi:hypothetical protein
MGKYGTDAAEKAFGYSYPRRLHAISIASQLYRTNHTRGLMYKVWSALTGRSRRLLDLAAVQAACDVHNRHAAGTRTVPIHEIRGSEGRSEDFDADFRPLRPHSKERWMRIAIAQQMGKTMPPVELVRVGDAYFVRDGHHRVSVARALGQKEIDAQITVWESPRPRSRERCMGAGVLETELMHQVVSSQPKVSPSCVT